MKLQLVPARTGLVWVRLGVRTFFKQPLALAGLFFMFMAAISLINLLPVLGNIVALALLPTMALTLMMATLETTQGRFPKPMVLLRLLRDDPARRRSILVLGALYAVGFLLLLGITSMFDGGEFARRFLLGGAGSDPVDSPLDLQKGMLLFMALHLPLSLAFWHAPALVHWHGVPPVKSLFFSLVACWRNKGAYIVFGLGWFTLVMCEGIVVQVAALLLNSSNTLGIGALVITLLTTSMFLTSTYFSFRDSFAAEEDLGALPKP